MYYKEFRDSMRNELRTKFTPISFFSRLGYAYIICTETISAALFAPYKPETDEPETEEAE